MVYPPPTFPVDTRGASGVRVLHDVQFLKVSEITEKINQLLAEILWTDVKTPEVEEGAGVEKGELVLGHVYEG